MRHRSSPGRHASLVPLATVVVAVGLSLLAISSGTVVHSDEEAPAVRHSVASSAETLLLTGRLTAREAEVLTAPVTSTWQLQLKWLVEEGVTVADGDPIARFDTATLSDQLIEIENQLIAAEQQRAVQGSDGALARLDLELALARAEIEYRKAALDATVPEEFLGGKDFRQRQLEEGKKKRAYEDAVLTLSTHDSTLRATLSGLDIQTARLSDQLERLERELEVLTVVATRPGIVVHSDHPWFGRKVREGDQMQATFPVARIPDLDTLEVEAWVSEVDAWRIAAGRRAELTLDAYPSRRYAGTIVDLAQAAELREAWGSEPYFRVRIEMDSLDQSVMKPGMSVRCRVLPPGEGGETATADRAAGATPAGGAP